MHICPTTEALQQLLQGALPAADADTIAEHVAGCRSCDAQLARLSDDPELRGWLAADAPVGAETPLPDGLVAGPVLHAWLGPPRRPGDLGSLGPYPVEAELGTGGMGIVLRGYDEDLQRTVALKVLRPELVHASARQRFVQEARAAARVRHDQVVTVFAVANPPDGPPYIAMELLEGASLAALIRARGTLEPRRAAGLVAQAADGLAAAHAAGLVHRDVKPANLLLDAAADRVKVSDFGLAYQPDPTGAGARLTQDGALLGTPAYMSPEQAQGAAVDARSDVYALGVMLYETLTGEVPFRGALHLVLRQIAHDEPRPPRQLNDAVPRDLETICLTAMAKESARRYPSAAAFADDLRRWQRGEPIRARPAGRVEKTWRWCRRNPGVAALSLALAAMFAAGLAGTSWQAWRASESAARADADRVLAEKRRDDAEQSQLVAIGAVDQFFTQVSQEQLLRQPQLQPLRRKLLEQALRNYRQFLEVHGENDRLRRETALAAHRLACVITEIGSSTDADAAYGEAIARLDQALERNPADTELRVKRSACHLTRGLTRQQLGDFAGARASLETAAELCRALRQEQPDDRGLQGNLLACYGNLANLHFSRGEHRAAVAWYEKVQAELEPLAEAAPENASLQRMLALNLHNLAVAQGAGRHARSIALFERAERLRRRLLEQAPDSWVAQRDLARTEVLLGDVHSKHGDLAAAQRYFEAGVPRLERLAQAEPARVDYRQMVAEAYLNWGGHFARHGQYEQALRTYALGQQQAQAALKIDPHARSTRHDLATMLRDAGNAALLLKQPARALPLLQDAVAQYRELAEPPGPRSTELANACRRLGTALAELQRTDAAFAAWDEGVQHARQALAAASSDAEVRRELNEQYQHLARQLRERGKPARAAELTQARAALWPDRADEQLAAACELAQAVAALPAGAERQRHAEATAALLRAALMLDPALRPAAQQRAELAALWTDPAFAGLARR